MCLRSTRTAAPKRELLISAACTYHRRREMMKYDSNREMHRDTHLLVILKRPEPTEQTLLLRSTSCCILGRIGNNLHQGCVDTTCIPRELGHAILPQFCDVNLTYTTKPIHAERHTKPCNQRLHTCPMKKPPETCPQLGRCRLGLRSRRHTAHAISMCSINLKHTKRSRHHRSNLGRVC